MTFCRVFFFSIRFSCRMPKFKFSINWQICLMSLPIPFFAYLFGLFLKRNLKRVIFGTVILFLKINFPDNPDPLPFFDIFSFLCSFCQNFYSGSSRFVFSCFWREKKKKGWVSLCFWLEYKKKIFQAQKIPHWVFFWYLEIEKSFKRESF